MTLWCLYDASNMRHKVNSDTTFTISKYIIVEAGSKGLMDEYELPADAYIVVFYQTNVRK